MPTFYATRDNDGDVWISPVKHAELHPARLFPTGDDDVETLCLCKAGQLQFGELAEFDCLVPGKWFPATITIEVRAPKPPKTIRHEGHTYILKE